MFALWSEATVCEYAGPSRDSTGCSIDLPARSRSESNRLLHYWIERAEAGTGFRWAVILNDNPEFAGAIGFNALGPCSEYAYHLVPRFWGAGLATEASRLALSSVRRSHRRRFVRSYKRLTYSYGRGTRGI